MRSTPEQENPEEYLCEHLRLVRAIGIQLLQPR